MLGWILSLIVVLVPISARAEGARVEFLDTKEEVFQNYCLTNPPGRKGDCDSNYYSKVVLLHPPKSFKQTILQHINEARQAGYYDEISHDDFFHGHLILKGPSIDYNTPEEYYSDVTSILYHSAEYNSRWGYEAQAGVAVEDRRPRSFMGWLDGTVQAAIDIFSNPLDVMRVYESHGTLYTYDVVKARPELSNHRIDRFGVYQTLKLKVCQGDDCRVCQPFGMFQIFIDPKSDLKTDAGESVEIFQRCHYARR